MRISRNRMSELAADVKLLLPFTAIPALFYFLVTSYQTGAVIGTLTLPSSSLFSPSHHYHNTFVNDEPSSILFCCLFVW
jgi:hypothetical protein